MAPRRAADSLPAGGTHAPSTGPATTRRNRSPRRYNRLVLTDDGTIPDLFFGDNRKPIDRFGK
jgi:hypothetical protein